MDADPLTGGINADIDQRIDQTYRRLIALIAAIYGTILIATLVLVSNSRVGTWISDASDRGCECECAVYKPRHRQYEVSMEPAGMNSPAGCRDAERRTNFMPVCRALQRASPSDSFRAGFWSD
jgi:hypothetical protein